MTAALVRRLGLAEAIGLSVAVVCPSVGMAFNVVLCVQVTGAAAPLAFLLGTAVMLVVAMSFVAFSRRQPSAGAAYAYITHAFGAWAGVLAGWTMLLAYLGFTTSMAALAADFVVAALAEAGVHASAAALPIAAGFVVACGWLAWRDTRFAGRLMLGMEAFSLTAILILACTVLVHVNAHHLWSIAPFSLRAAPHGLSSLGYGMVFAILSVAGFEGATTLSEETADPRRTVPRAMLATVLGSGVFFVFVSYATVLGFGLDRMGALATAQAPLDDLARVSIGWGFAGVLDCANAISAFSSILGALTGATRLAFALGRGGLSTRLATIDPRHDTPARAVLLCTALILIPLCICLLWISAADYYGYLSTIATLAMILVYASVTIAEAVEAARLRKIAWCLLGISGTLGLSWALLCSILPVPPPPANLWPPLVLAWVAAGFLLPVIRPGMTQKEGLLL